MSSTLSKPRSRYALVVRNIDDRGRCLQRIQLVALQRLADNQGVIELNDFSGGWLGARSVLCRH